MPLDEDALSIQLRILNDAKKNKKNLQERKDDLQSSIDSVNVQIDVQNTIIADARAQIQVIISG